VAWSAALSTAGVAGVAYAALQPRGPQTSAGGVAVMVLGLLLGGLAGLLLHRRGGTLAVLAVH